MAKIRGNFIGATIVAIIYTIYFLMKPIDSTSIVALIILNLLTIVLMYFAFSEKK